MQFWLLIILFLNGIISFVNDVKATPEPTKLWAFLAVNFVFFLNVSQTGIAFSAIMRIVKSEWGRYYSRLGEILTLSFIPMAVTIFYVLYSEGIDYLFYLAPLSKGSFLWRHIITMAIFYIVSYIYFRTGRIEEKGVRVTYNIKRRLNLLASMVIASFVITNTNTSWDFGMTIIPNWESSVFPPYFWVGSIYAGTAFLLIAAIMFIRPKPENSLNKEHLSPIGKLLLGYAMLWIYMLWSQYIVIWYEDLPDLTEPLFRQMGGNYRLTFFIMIVSAFALPFIALIQRGIRHSSRAMFIVASIVCIGIWTNRYLMILPVFSDGSIPIVPTWTGISLIVAGPAASLLSIIFFFILFPGVTAISK